MALSGLKLARFFHPDLGVGWGIIKEDQVHYLEEDNEGEMWHFVNWLYDTTEDLVAAVTALSEAAEKSTTSFPVSLFDQKPTPGNPLWLAPTTGQDVWAAGVTYERSREARQEESIDGGDVYARVYTAERPELFFKAHSNRVVGHYDDVGIRADATWSVPEPELGLVINPKLQVVGFTIGNDMSSRDIEGENPLYLPQAKVYNNSCAIGSCIVIQPMETWPKTTISIQIQRENETVFEGSIHTDRIHRTMQELVDYLGRSNDFPHGVILLTGTGIVPPNEFTLTAGDIIQIDIEGIGSLINTVKVV